MTASLLSAPARAATISTFAGNGLAGFSGDGGPATAAQINNPFGVVRGPDGNIWFCEYSGQRVRKVTADGKIHTVAGSGQKGYSGDGGPALQATFNLPHEIRFDRAGDLYIVDMGNHAVRKVDLKSGVITTFAGTGKAGYSGDGGPAKDATFKQPHSIQFDPAGNHRHLRRHGQGRPHAGRLTHLPRLAQRPALAGLRRRRQSLARHA